MRFLYVLVCMSAATVLIIASRLEPADPYPLHTGITATVFWVGEPGNTASAWDDVWMEHFGGVDTPDARKGYRPAGFTPRENPFYCALPYNDFLHGTRRPSVHDEVPWAGKHRWKAHESMCKNRWVRIRHGDKTAYAQWEDVGPFRTDDHPYVFGTKAPVNTDNQGAGIDVAPAVRDYLGLTGMDRVDWQFVPASEVRRGPWKDCVTTSGVYWK